MANLTTKEKQTLISMYKNNRREIRCMIEQSLSKEVIKLTKDMNLKLAILADKTKELQAAKEDILVEHKLLNFAENSSYGCRKHALHHKLLNHDKETNRTIRRILLNKVGDDLAE